MRRGLLIVLAALAIGLGACGAPAVPKGAIDLASRYASMEKTGHLPRMVSVPPETVPDFYGIDQADYTDALFKVSADSLLADEVVLIRAKDEASAASIRSLLQARLEAKAEEAQSYSPVQYAIIKKGILLSQGLEVALIVSPEAEALAKIYQTGQGK